MRQGKGPTVQGRCAAACIVAALAALCALPREAAATAAGDPDRPSHNLFGVTGTIDTPSARMQPEGQVTATTGYFGGFLRNTVSAQVFEGVEAAFRYSVLDDYFPSGETTLYDRSFDIKVRFVREGPYWPSMVVGFQDFLGTGVYSGEYLAASKTFLGGDLTLTGGVGWGRFAGTNGLNNPYALANEGFEARDEGEGGEVNFGQYFQGEEVGLFAGVEWRTPLDGLTVKAEYADDDYAREERFSGFDQEMPLNIGAEYRVTDWLEIGAYYLYGSEAGLRATISRNIHDPPARADGAPPPLPFTPRPEGDARAAEARLGAVESRIAARGPGMRFSEAPVTEVTVEERIAGVRWARAALAPSAEAGCPADAAAAIDAHYGVIDVVTFEARDGTPACTVALRPEGKAAIRLTRRAAETHPTAWHGDEARRAAVVEALEAALAEAKIGLFGVELEPGRATVYIENGTYRSTPRAIGRTARALARTMPPSVAHFEVVPLESSLPVVAVALDRSALEDRVNRPDAARDIWTTALVTDAEPLRARDVERVEPFPRISWSLEPAVPISLFDPDQPARFDLAAVATAGVEIMPGLSLNAAIEKRIVGQLDDIERESDSELPRVRSDIARYLEEGDPALVRLSADYLAKLDDAVYARLSGGLLERMYGGVSGEVLWKPANSDWAVGAEVNYVRQRGFDTLFSFRDYDVVTGHASVYWDTPFWGVSAQLDAGRYLAGDYGGTITLSRRFANGWELGGFATFTDTSFDEFGEGSFDKGLFLTIPLDWALPYPTRSELSTTIRPLTRDGGQRLDVSNRLYPIVRDQDAGGLHRTRDSFWQ